MLCIGIFPIEEVIDSKQITFIYSFRCVDRLNHRSDDNIRIEDCQLKYRFLGGEEIPSRLLAQFLRCVVAQSGGLGFDCFIFRDLVT
jgi:hypothetical protein